MASSSTNRKTMLLRQHTGPISSGFSKRASESGQARQHRRRCRRTKPRCRQQPSVFRRLRRSASRLCALQLSQPQPERSANSKSRFIHMSGGYRRNYYTHVCRWTMLRRNHVDPQVPWNTFLSLVAPLPPSKANMKSTDHAQHQYPCTSQPSRQRMVLVQGRRRRRAPRTSCRRTRTPCPSRSCCRGRRRPPAHGIRRASAWPQLGFVPVASFAPPTFT